LALWGGEGSVGFYITGRSHTGGRGQGSGKGENKEGVGLEDVYLVHVQIKQKSRRKDAQADVVRQIEDDWMQEKAEHAR
jgi:hypothetical protein